MMSEAAACKKLACSRLGFVSRFFRVAEDRSIVPEGHTIHREALDQHPMLVGQVLAVTSPQGRFVDGAALLDGRACTALEAYGKHLLYSFADDRSLHIHLGLYGKFRKSPRPAPAPVGAVRVESGTFAVDSNGPNRCEVLEPLGVAALLARIGPDVLRPDADPERAWARIARSRAPVGLLIMDQSVMAGIGNIYRSEILWRQCIAPERPGASLDRTAFDRIWDDAARLLAIGVRERAIITVEGAARGPGRYGGVFNIFAKDTCPRCGGAVRKFAMAGRRAFACDTCQPMP